ncbi:insulinase family protein [Legionella israelensis]|uniref:M16 family metallopeptidase n=1 Tax=Legionella israelensis TaxID=454 RepID=UPI00117D694C|nr:pitrilysin family protein [Legionella israelensis]QDP71835.1 insulinase family protein [Legionella israelensis]
MNTFKNLTIFFFISFLGLAEAKSFHTEGWLTPNGTRVVFYQTKEVPILDIQIAFAAGSAYDDKHFGLSTLTTNLLNQGNAGLNATEIAERLAETGAQYSADSSRDMVVVSLRTLTRQDALQKAVDTFIQIIGQPDFPEQAVEREKKQQITAIEQSMESPDRVATDAFFKLLYQQHPYAHPVLGTVNQVQALSRKEVIQFYKTYFVAANAVLVIVGDIDSSSAHQLAESISKNLPRGTFASTIPKAKTAAKTKELNIPYPSSQTILRMGQLGIDHHSPIYFPLMVGNYILGGGSLVSRLAIEVREKRGLTYGAYSQFIPMPGDGPFLISLSTKNEQAKEALNVTMNTVKNFLSKGPDEIELRAAKQYLTGSFPLSLASNKNIATMLLKIAFYHLPDDFLDTYIKNVEQVSLKDIEQAFKQEIHPDKFLFVTVGRQA